MAGTGQTSHPSSKKHKQEDPVKQRLASANSALWGMMKPFPSEADALWRSRQDILPMCCTGSWCLWKGKANFYKQSEEKWWKIQSLSIKAISVSIIYYTSSFPISPLLSMNPDLFFTVNNCFCSYLQVLSMTVVSFLEDWYKYLKGKQANFLEYKYRISSRRNTQS